MPARLIAGRAGLAGRATFAAAHLVGHPLTGAVLTRAGGGESFGGGGGGFSGGGFSGGGGFGGFPIFLGGGGGGGSIGAIITVISILLFFTFMTQRIRRGMRRGIPMTPRPYPRSDQPAYAPGSLPGDAPGQPASGTSGLAAITAHDPDFNVDAFKASVERAFFVIEEAWSECKPDMSRRVMADGLWQQHKAQIEQYEAKGQRNMLDGLAVGKVTIERATSDQQYDTITARILAACADYDIEVSSGKVTRGNKHNMTNWQEDWVFQRSSNATTKAGGGTLEQKCPNCGAPLDLDLAGVCKYCRAPVMSGAYDWVLTRIDQV